MHKEHVYIGLGSNQGDSEEVLSQAMADIDVLENSRLLARSSLYVSSPMGPQDQPNFVNAVCLAETSLPPAELLCALQDIEQAHGRVRKADRWGPRTLDLDILLYGNQHIDTPDLTIPHYGMADREFVLVPLFEIAPSMIMPDGKPLALWVAKCNLDGLKRLPTSNQR
ncbi:2-amino-4-hydroxy-6-hydroxymethyldihydropteridine diphosphokinase [Aestuariibacter sp. A3R04]|uniref:2-amino-4-hydroxy-6- hydroxymethyldihydropteridine diphosphokinase n=1 Tax=Aestuariibacter sp. A3R04 TaxID=2841571 RepID=UPI001C0A551C|nr:2-amino-4-hydroxy-6-hydroxymethyldihydropteridine diphosphokinase [Aestuariibacter sp. A3R04]MBU3023904.1 2-amino-4-hydroxy-6-hydroxymethyldihydropteridine diphosphokinase [Aestuariibacter sp. A3R04]